MAKAAGKSAPKAKAKVVTAAEPSAPEKAPAPEGQDEDEEPVTLMTFDGDDDEAEVEETPAPAEAPVTNQDLARAVMSLAATQAAVVEAAPIKKVPYARFKTRSPFNPTGSKKRVLTRKCHQNLTPMNIHLLHDEEISLLNQLKPGRYLGGLIVVTEWQVGTESRLNIAYKNKTMDQRMALKSEFRNLLEMLRRCVSEGASAQ